MTTTKEQIRSILRGKPGLTTAEIIERVPDRNNSHIRAMITELVKFGEITRGYIVIEPGLAMPQLAGKCPCCGSTDFVASQDGPKNGKIDLICVCRNCKTAWEENYTVTGSKLYREGT